jgi:hypothetical protein
MNKRRLIPECLWNTDEYSTLTSREKEAIEFRVLALRVLGEELSKTEYDRGEERFNDFLEDIGLDLLTRAELPNIDQGDISIWRIHYSWTFLTSPEEMRTLLSNDIISVIDSNLPSSSASIKDVYCCIVNFGKVLVRLTAKLEKSKNIHEALASHLAIDILVSKLIVVCHMQQFNPNLNLRMGRIECADKENQGVNQQCRFQ